MIKIEIKLSEKQLKVQEIFIPGKRRFGRIMTVDFKYVKSHQEELGVHFPRSMRAKSGPAEGNGKAQNWISEKLTNNHGCCLKRQWATCPL